MNTSRTITVVLAVGALAYFAGRSSIVSDHEAMAQQSGKDKPQTPQQPQGMDAHAMAMMTYGKVGPSHKVLESAVGTYQGVVKFRMTPNADWVSSEGTVTREWVLGNRFLRETVEATSEWGPFSGIAYIGYNNYDGLYEAIWMENHSTAMFFETGTYNPETKVMTMRGTRRDFATGRLVNGRGEWNLGNSDHHTFAGYSIDASGREYKSFEGDFKRVK